MILFGFHTSMRQGRGSWDREVLPTGWRCRFSSCLAICSEQLGGSPKFALTSHRQESCEGLFSANSHGLQPSSDEGTSLLTFPGLACCFLVLVAAALAVGYAISGRCKLCAIRS